jgi:hypothetical protein
VPVERAFATKDARDVAVRLLDDSTHWWRVRQAHLVGDTIVGLSKASGHLRRAAIARDQVVEVVVRESDPVANDALTRLGEMACILGFVVFIGVTWSLFTVKAFSR